MSAIKTVASAAAPAAPVAPAPVSYGAWAMTDLSEHFYWSSCEVLNAKGSSGLWNALKPGLRDQETLLLESDADEQLLATVVFNGRVKVHSIQVKRVPHTQVSRQSQTSLRQVSHKSHTSLTHGVTHGVTHPRSKVSCTLKAQRASRVSSMPFLL